MVNSDLLQNNSLFYAFIILMYFFLCVCLFQLEEFQNKTVQIIENQEIVQVQSNMPAENHYSKDQPMLMELRIKESLKVIIC